MRTLAEVEWYLRAAVECGWSRNVLVLQIKSRLHERKGKALTNFQRALPPPDSDMAEQVLTDLQLRFPNRRIGGQGA
jgi:predicted nuclease of restriction endonuclease-like (RecB) superfamily